MPRFLDTHTGEFHWFEDPSTVSYAILSHTWRADDKEQTFAQVQEMWKGSRGIREHSDASEVHDAHDVDPFFLLPELCDKIKGICKVAREAGYRFVWIDTCCIDKTSSAELAEAINTMFMLYKLAQVCYVYLEKVPDGENPRSKTSQFRRSRWHTRGWTLQELIAPWSVVFLSETWTMLGTKMTLAATLAAITNIDLSVLTGRESLDTVSVARRMSWASSRQTKRVEDRAYSLLGIFGVQLSPIYGEGMNAFIRLQEEIIKTIPDQSIFAWGRRCTLMSIDGGLNLGTAPPQYAGDLDTLLAPSPSFFGPAYGINMLTPKQYASRLNADLDRSLLWRHPVPGVSPWRPPPRLLEPHPNIVPPPVQSTPIPQGLRISLVCVDLSPEAFRLLLAQDGAEACELCRPAVRLALLPCEDQRGDLVAPPGAEPRG